MLISGRSFTSCDVLVAKDDLLCDTAAHADIHLGQKLRAGLAPAIVLWKHGHLRGDGGEDVREKAAVSSTKFSVQSSRSPYMSQTGASGHDGSLIDWHCVFGVISHNCMA